MIAPCFCREAFEENEALAVEEILAQCPKTLGEDGKREIVLEVLVSKLSRVKSHD